MVTRNITLTLPDQLVRKAKVYAARQDISVSGLVAGLLAQTVESDDDYDAVWEEELRRMNAGLLRVGNVALSRESAHQR